MVYQVECNFNLFSLFQSLLRLMFCWTKTLTSEPKISEAYNMLKRQGIILEDPVAPEEEAEATPPPPPREDTLFKDEEKQKVQCCVMGHVI